MIRAPTIWFVFALCLAAVAGALGWASLTVVRLERAEARAAGQAALEERVRLALWRMDSAMAPLIALEGARPYFSYSSFYPAGRAYERMFNRAQQSDALVPSPLLAGTPPHVLLHFQLAPDGTITSPQVPFGRFRELAEAESVPAEKTVAAAARLEQLKPLLDRGALLAALGREAPDRSSAVLAQATPEPPQSVMNMQEWRARAANLSAQQANRDAPGMAGVVEGQVRPLWAGSSLLLVRGVTVGGAEYLQGCLLDFDALRTSLLGGVRDLLPSAALEPAESVSAEQGARMLASLPVRLMPGDLPAVGAPASPLWWSLLIAWACATAAAAGTALLLRQTLSLSERRGAFVSAVTHELRTPLTTFRMYAEMLAEGMVRDDRKRREYLATLCREADRLDHLVENVLAFARLDGSRAGAPVTAVALEELLEASRQRLAERAARDGMTLVVEPVPRDGPRHVQANPPAVEQILMNLVDNACKYARAVEDRRLHLSVARRGRMAAVCLRDHGPGVSRRRRGRLFRAFSKSSAEAADSVSGVGLGLALSRRLARSMGGDLRLDPGAAGGACFALLLRQA